MSGAEIVETALPCPARELGKRQCRFPTVRSAGIRETAMPFPYGSQ
ncbi:hypothetical protein QUB05_26750 [Microcoleus sp. F10-C6]